MMTFKQAYTQWCAIPENTALGAKTKIAVDKVLLDVCADMDVTLIDSHYVDMLLKNSKVIDYGLRVNAISVLGHVLTWLHNEKDPKTYPLPDFTISIVSTGKPANATFVSTSTQKVVKKPSFSVPQKKESQIKTDKTMNPKETANKEKKVKNDGQYLRRSVVQIDMDTLQEVARFNTASAAERQLHIKNVLRSIDRHGTSGGYYWEFADLFKEGWQPTKRRQDYHREVPEAAIETAAAKNVVTNDSSEMTIAQQREFLQSIPDAMILEEIRRRDNWHGTISYTTIVTETF